MTIDAPVIETLRLRLRGFDLGDAQAVQRLASDAEIAATTLSIPHPYPEGAAAEWIRKGQELIEQGSGLPLAITLREGDALIGSIGLSINEKHRHAEMGYWIGLPYWGSGYATEAARALLTYAFERIDLNRVFAHHMVHNAASERVLEKLGMQREGLLHEHILKYGRYIDIALVGMTRQMYDAQRHDASTQA